MDNEAACCKSKQWIDHSKPEDAPSCHKPIRQHPTHKLILEPDAFEDWSVDLNEPVLDHEELSSELFEDWHFIMSEPICVDETLSPEHFSVSSQTPTSHAELVKSFPARHYTPYQDLAVTTRTMMGRLGQTVQHCPDLLIR